MMDPAADDLLSASIGRSPRNDPDPPGPHHADYHGLPLDNATVPASTEARTRQKGEKRGGASTGGVLGEVRRSMPPPSRKHGAPSPAGPTETTTKRHTRNQQERSWGRPGVVCHPRCESTGHHHPPAQPKRHKRNKQEVSWGRPGVVCPRCESTRHHHPPVKPKRQTRNKQEVSWGRPGVVCPRCKSTRHHHPPVKPKRQTKIQTTGHSQARHPPHGDS